VSPTKQGKKECHNFKKVSTNKVPLQADQTGSQSCSIIFPLLKRKLEAKAKANTITIADQGSRLWSSGAAPPFQQLYFSRKLVDLFV
jgi:hypothetical protein